MSLGPLIWSAQKTSQVQLRLHLFPCAASAHGVDLAILGSRMVVRQEAHIYLRATFIGQLSCCESEMWMALSLKNSCWLQ